MPARRSLRTRNALTTNRSPPAPAPAASRRPRRTASGLGEQVTIARESSDSPESGQKGIRLTVKMPSNKLREATSHGRRSAPDGLEPAVIISGPRSNRGKKSYVVESETDEEEEEVEDTEEDIPLEDQVGEPEATDDDIDAEENQDEEEEEEQDQAADEDEGESGEGDGDEDEDVEMEDESPMPPPPVMKLTGPTSKPSVTVTPAKNVKLKSVEAKEMEMEDDDEDLSSISEGEEDAEGEDVGEGDELDLDDEGDIQSTGIGSRASTPDVSKMTKRQKSRLSEVMSRDDFLQLPMEPQIKKHLTAEEHAMRRAEMARRRKNLSEKRNEEEKMDTINRLLKKQAPKRRGKISQAEITANAAAGADSAPSEEPEVENANPIYVRWISDAKGCRVGVPEEWLEGPAGRVFGGSAMGGSGKLVEEV